MDDVPPTQDEPATEVRDHSMDFYRVAALVLVVLGHWVAASLTYRDGSFWRENPLVHLPWTQWLTWMFQVVPVFFVVAGYASAVAWSRHRHSGGAGRQARLVEGDRRRLGQAQHPRDPGQHLRGGRGRAIGEVDQPHARRCAHRRQRRRGDVVAVDAVEDLPRLDDRPGLARAELAEHVAGPRPVDPGDPQDVERDTMPQRRLGPGRLGREPSPGVGGARGRGAGLVDPVAAAIAIDGGRGVIADPAQRRRPGLAQRLERRAGILAGRGRDQQVGHAGEPRRVQPAVRVEREGTDALGRQCLRARRVADRGADAAAGGDDQPGHRPGGIARPDQQQVAPRECAHSGSSISRASSRSKAAI